MIFVFSDNISVPDIDVIFTEGSYIVLVAEDSEEMERRCKIILFNINSKNRFGAQVGLLLWNETSAPAKLLEGTVTLFI